MRRILGQGTHRAVAPVDEAGVLIDASDYYRAFFHAARAARKYIAIAGWQFDSDVCLLRGDEQQAAGCETRLLPFLRSLCEARPELQIYLLAWDFNVLFVLEREWMQKLVFNWNSHPNIKFRFDSNHTTWGSHHQKFVVVDGSLGFAGGMDICSSRWDDRQHLCEQPGRNESGKQHGPYHDVQAYLRGAAVQELARIFEERWEAAGAGTLRLPAPVPVDVKLRPTIPLAASRAAISRTVGRTLTPPQDPVKEIRALYLRAIDAAESHLYIENQYFTSHAIYRALVARLREPDRSRLEIVVVLPTRAEAMKEQFAHGLEQAKLLRSLKDIAEEHGHSVGIYTCSAPNDVGEEKSVYIHAKLMIVDDRFITIGSANTTNRSMGADTELNVSFESTSRLPWSPLKRSIRETRVSLLAEHTGILDGPLHPMLERTEGLVRFLDRIATGGLHRIRHHTMSTMFDQNDFMRALKPDFVWDPERPIEEDLHELMSRDERGVFARGIQLLGEFLETLRGEPTTRLSSEADRESDLESEQAAAP